MLDLHLIEPHPDNPRKIVSNADVEDLANSIRRIKLSHPIHVQLLPRKRYRVISGERRLRALQLTGWPQIPAFVHNITEEEALQWMCEENLHRRNLSVMAKSRAVELLRGRLGKSPQEVAAITGWTASAVANKRKLMALPAKWQLLVEEERLVERGARAIAMYAQQGRTDVVDAAYVAFQKNPEAWKVSALSFEQQLATLAAGIDAGRQRANRRGPEPVNQFLWNGTQIALPPTSWRVVNELWKAPERRLSESALLNKLPHNAGVPPDLRAACKKAAALFRKKKWPVLLSIKQGYVSLIINAG